MAKLRKYANVIERFLHGSAGQRFFNFAYSIGAAIVIWGALFKILHLPGGSTLGSISTAHLSVPTVDIGLPQLAMHSVCETAGAADTDFLISAMAAYFSGDFRYDDDGGITLSIPARSFMYRPKNSPSSTRQSGVCLLSGIVNTLSHSSEKP